MGTDQPLVWGMSRHPRLLGAKHWAWCRWRHLSTCLATENMYDSPSRLELFETDRYEDGRGCGCTVQESSILKQDEAQTSLIGPQKCCGYPDQETSRKATQVCLAGGGGKHA